MSKRVHILMGGPIRPTLGYVAKCLNDLKKKLKNSIIVTHLVTWKIESDFETVEVLNGLFDNVYFIDEPTTDDVLSKNIQTVQMKHMGPSEFKSKFVVNMYRMFFAYKQLVHMCSIDDNDVVIRIRTDLYIKNDDHDLINKIATDCKENTIYIRPNRGCLNLSDWFAICDYKTFKKTYYIENDDKFRQLADISYNPEEVIVKNAYQNGVNSHFIDSNMLIIHICREFKDGVIVDQTYD